MCVGGGGRVCAHVWVGGLVCWNETPVNTCAESSIASDMIRPPAVENGVLQEVVAAH